MHLTKDHLHPSPEEKRKHKKHLVQSPNSCFIDVKCPGDCKMHSLQPCTTVIWCVLCQLTGGKVRLTEGCSCRRKQHSENTLKQEE
ncbi:PREDICTED: 40S ribosomal protein S27-like [Elephantulus edwardii]|uniref:40S ribosomal protein S27-like n=1 Tax=Elephantulus edwardii TaxID=28737 RepID=UPI0003F0883A|nr:PREDICTED: 40S ribosomal protein S27-like [Elephantulus edwardii]